MDKDLINPVYPVKKTVSEFESEIERIQT